jgi:archaellin
VKFPGISRAHRAEHGFADLGPVFILIAFLVAAISLAFVVFTTGIFSAKRGQETVYAGLQKGSSAVEVRGGVAVRAIGCPSSCAVSEIEFSVGNAASDESLPLDWAASTHRTSIAYRDESTINDDMRYIVTWVTGNGDDVLDPGELATITIRASDNPGTLANLKANERWTLEIQTSLGSIVDVERSLPAQISAIMQLH